MPELINARLWQARIFRFTFAAKLRTRGLALLRLSCGKISHKGAAPGNSQRLWPAVHPPPPPALGRRHEPRRRRVYLHRCQFVMLWLRARVLPASMFWKPVPANVDLGAKAARKPDGPALSYPDPANAGHPASACTGLSKARIFGSGCSVDDIHRRGSRAGPIRFATGNAVTGRSVMGSVVDHVLPGPIIGTNPSGRSVTGLSGCRSELNRSAAPVVLSAIQTASKP
jgi:hypothetical protein